MQYALYTLMTTAVSPSVENGVSNFICPAAFKVSNLVNDNTTVTDPSQTANCVSELACAQSVNIRRFTGSAGVAARPLAFVRRLALVAAEALSPA